MRKKKKYSILFAWVLLLVFTAAHLCKDFDFHLSQDQHLSLKTEKANTKAVVKAACPICDFTWQKSESAKNITFTPVLIGILINHYDIKELTIWRPIYSVNAHSPPLFRLV